MRYDGTGSAKLLEYNADTPTSVFETAVFQWGWLEDATAQGLLPDTADQFNSLHDKLIAGWSTTKALYRAKTIHFAGMLDSPEDAGTLAYLADTAKQAGADVEILAIEAIGRTPKGSFVDAADRPIDLAFKLYPWEWMFRDQFGESLPGAPTRWIEPPWKAILSNKGILPLLWAMFPRHPNLLPAYFADDFKRAEARALLCTKAALFARRGKC